jgi:serine/threonine protein phosphatase 1
VTEDQSGIPMKPRTIAIGDIHGCSTALNRLIEVIQPREQDTVVILGDVIDGGPDSRGVIERLLRLSEECRLIPLLGNHEEMLLAARDSRSELGYWMKFGGEATLNSYGLSGTMDGFPWPHLNFVKSCRLWHEEDDFLFVHANYDPRLPMERQSGTRLRWEHLDSSEAKPHFSRKTVIVGHTPQMEGNILDLGFVVCLDTGCCEGGWLTALEVTTGHVWQSNQQGELRERERELRESHA